MQRTTFFGVLKLAPALGAFALIVGCGRNSEIAYTSPETPKNSMVADQQSTSDTPSATSDTNAPDHVYSGSASDATTADAKDTGNTVKAADQ